MIVVESGNYLKIKNKTIFKFERQSAQSKKYFATEFNYIKPNFKTIEKYFNHRLFQ